jgi:hypothetical protein
MCRVRGSDLIFIRTSCPLIFGKFKSSRIRSGAPSLFAFRNRVKLRFPGLFGFRPRALNPRLLFETNERGVEGSLVQLYRTFRELFEAGRDGVSVLRTHGLERPQNNRIQCSGKNLNPLIFTWHSSESIPLFHLFVKWKTSAPRSRAAKTAPPRDF